MRELLAVLVLLVVSGCSARMVIPPGSTTASPNAPVNEAERPGLVRYLNRGPRSFIEKRRADAYRQMHQVCAARYRIVTEGPRAVGAVVETAGSTAFARTTEYWYIQFECVRDEG